MSHLRKPLLIVMGVIWLLPIYLMIANATKTDQQYADTSLWMPGGLDGLVENFSRAWTQGRISSGIASTAIYAIVAPIVAALIGALGGFSMVALKLRRGFFWFVLIFCSTVFPMQMLLMPLFMGYVQFNIFDTRFGMVLIYTAISVPFAVFVMRNFMTGISYTVYEAAVIDGAGPFRVFWSVYLPMSRSALFAIFVLQATFVWNDLLLGLTLSQSEDVRPVMTALSALQSTYGGSTMPTVLAAGLIVSLPTAVLFLSTQRTFSRGLALGQY